MSVTATQGEQCELMHDVQVTCADESLSIAYSLLEHSYPPHVVQHACITDVFSTCLH